MSADILPVKPCRTTLGPIQRERTHRAVESVWLWAYQAMQTIDNPDATLAELNEAQKLLAAAERAARGARLELVRRTR